jgi:hypothetical protein
MGNTEVCAARCGSRQQSVRYHLSVELLGVKEIIDKLTAILGLTFR